MGHRCRTLYTSTGLPPIYSTRSAPSLAKPNKAQYELEERCGQAARAMFEKDWEDKSMQREQDRPIWCFVADTTCHSKAEWQTFVKPYMER